MYSRVTWTSLIFIIIFLVFSSLALGQTIRFCPSNSVPIAFNPATKTYEEGASFDPLACADEPCIELLHNIFEPLVSVSDSQVIEPELATGWERLDEVTFRFTLRQGVTFHNGEPFDAEAVRFSLMRASQTYGVTAWFPEIARVNIVDSYTLDVVLKKPDSLFLYRLGHIGLIQPPTYFREVGPASFGKRPIGTGAFQFVRWDGKRREIHLEANPRYWREGYPKAQHLIYTY
ncbi:MAG: ABC transporter substrate-binding protein, partial [Nitrospira sp.]|nr:ABC transporter substrate-binding protein [Nitrospira sp.]